MAISVSCASHVGFGYQVTATGITGPVPLDDQFSVGVRQSGAPNFLCGGINVLQGHTFAVCYLGLSDTGGLALSLDTYVAPGATVQLEWAQHHANGTLVDSGIITGLVWDPTGGVGNLVSAFNQLSAGGLVGKIYNAVVHTFPPT